MEMNEISKFGTLRSVEPRHSYETVAEVIVEAVRNYPDRQISYLTSEGERVFTYFEAYEEALRILTGLKKSGVNPGQVVVAALDEPNEFVPCIWACVLGGVRICPISPRVTDMTLWTEHVSYLSRLFDNPVYITNFNNRELFDEHPVVIIEQMRNEQGSEAEIETNLSDKKDTAFLMLSSGSTGNPKAIVLTNENILASLEGKRIATGIDSSDVVMNWVAFDHVASLTECHLLPVYVGASQVQVTPTEIATDPVRFLEIASERKVTHTFAPNFLFGQILNEVENKEHIKNRIEKLDLSSLARIISGGEANVCSTGKRFLERFSKQNLNPSSIWPAFGMTETCAGSIYSTAFLSEVETKEKEFASLGWPIAGMELRIQSSDGKIAKVGEEGELQLRGKMVFGEYFADQEATAQAFTADGWFRTGDLGLLEKNTKSLRLVGRTKDSLIVNGVNYFLQDLENAIGELEGVSASRVACFPTRKSNSDTESLIVFYVPINGSDSPEILHRINSAIRYVTVLRWGFRPELILPVDDDVITKTTLGKIQRNNLRNRYENGEFDDLIREYKTNEAKVGGALVAPSNDEENKIVQEYSNILGISTEEIGVNSSFFNLGGTSLEILRLLSTVNEHSETSMSLSELIRDPTPHAIAEFLRNEGGKVEEYNPVVTLQNKGNSTPIFFLHPGVGEVLVFVNLANLFLNERRVYAMRARGFSRNEPFFSSFDELVSVYFDSIRAYQPSGPYILAGYSYGGPVALPIAQKLEAMGEVVHTFIIDAPPVIEHPRGDVDEIESALMLAFFLGFIDRDQVDEYNAVLRQSPELEPASFLYSKAPSRRIKELGQSLSSFRHWNKLAHRLSQIGIGYEPKGVIDNVTVFYADPIWGDQRTYFDTMLRKWDGHSRRPVRYVEVPGEHHTLLNPKYVDKFYEIFESELKRIESVRRR
ncbi:non-ribosomal peptide synthetase [Actinomyces oris]|uniref:non-ribosomal peptide synthetase n=1 Tax=Actinomyces oris TaxID=544580 RepID=UPI000B2ACAAD|nr:non-ribosomal peptide synthetase [Actinomyces oris]